MYIYIYTCRGYHTTLYHIMTVFVIGGAGALGSAFIAATRDQDTVCIDLRDNPQATHNARPGLPYHDCARYATDHNVVVCTAGSWSGGQLRDHNEPAMDALISSNLKPALWSAGLAHHLNACLVLTSAHASLSAKACTTMAAYGAVKAAVNHIAETASASGLPCVLLLPAVLDTAANRESLGEEEEEEGQVAQWTPCQVVAQWAVEAAKRVDPASLVRVSILTRDGKTEFKIR